MNGVVLDVTFPKVVTITVKFGCFLQWKKSDCAPCIRFPQQIGPVEDNTTIA